MGASLSEDLKARPGWATWFQGFGGLCAHLHSAEVGERSLRVVVSAPTGQFIPWMLAAGALGIEPSHIPSDPIVEGARYATWLTPREHMGDAVFHADRTPGLFRFEAHQNQMITEGLHPVRRIPDITPEARSSAPPKKRLRARLRHLPGLENKWHTWWARHCVSPIVIVGDGRTYLDGQRTELLEKVPHWFTDTTRELLSEESGQVSNPERMYFHPFMLFSPEAGNNKPWLRQMKPRLVIVTSWSAYIRRHQGFFASAPHVIIANRRVKSALDAAERMEFDASVRPHQTLEGLPPPPGIQIRSFDTLVQVDTGDIEDDESEWGL